MKRLLPIALLSILLCCLLSGCFPGMLPFSFNLPISNNFHVHQEVVLEAKAATCTEDGLTQGLECATCGEVLLPQNVIPAKNHQPAKLPAQDPTCTADGLTEGTACADCGLILEAQASVPKLAHTPRPLAGKAPACMEDGLTDGSICLICSTVLEKQQTIPRTGHEIVRVAGKAATCTSTGLSDGSKCQKCNLVVVPQETLPLLEHKSVVTPDTPATCVSGGTTGGRHCERCGKVLVAPTVVPGRGEHELVVTPSVLPSKPGDPCQTQGISCKHCSYTTLKAYDPHVYYGDYGYDFLGTLDNGANLQKVYMALDHMAILFHLNPNATASYDDYLQNYYTEYYDISSLKLTAEEFRRAYMIYWADNPLFYWMDGYAYYHNSNDLLTRVALRVNNDYLNSGSRHEISMAIYQGIQNMATTSKSPYALAKYYHDTINNNMYYAYESDGVTAQDATWAHNIVGYFLYGTGVCECYAEVFYIMMTFSGAECLRVDGTPDAPHAWNLAKMDDGGWYWFDLTWDDSLESYDYFCVNDTERIRWNGNNFLSEHIPNTPTSGFNYLYTLPKRSTKVYPNKPK